MYRIRKKFKFEMAHKLMHSYSIECQNIHGHSYVLEIIIDSISLDSFGMVIDFKLLKKIVNELISEFDHALVVCGIDHDFNNFFTISKSTTKLITVPYNPTAENMCRDFYDRIYHNLSCEISGMVNLIVRLHETETGYAEYSGEN